MVCDIEYFNFAYSPNSDWFLAVLLSTIILEYNQNQQLHCLADIIVAFQDHSTQSSSQTLSNYTISTLCDPMIETSSIPFSTWHQSLYLPFSQSQLHCYQVVFISP